MPSYITQKEFSDLTGTSRQAVSKAIKAGHVKVKMIQKKRKVVLDDPLTQLWYEKQISKNAEAPLQGKQSTSEKPVSNKNELVNLQRDKIIEEIGKIKAERKLKELKFAKEREDLIEKETIAAVLFQYINALNINMLDIPEMVVDTMIDKVKAGVERGALIKIMRDKIQKPIVNTKNQIKERLK